jgi:hypothetical protein
MTMSRGHRLLLKCARLVHVYLTMFGFLLVLFFALTGFMLNHDEWFGSDEPYKRTTTGSVPTRLLKPPDKLAIVELLRKDFGVRGALDDFDDKDEGAPVRVVFKAPGRQDEATIQRSDGQTTVVHESRGLIALMTDLHRGKSTGLAWGLVIDGVCVLLLIISSTGLILWSSLRGRAHYGLVVMGLGLVVGVGVYYLFVP